MHVINKGAFMAVIKVQSSPALKPLKPLIIKGKEGKALGKEDILNYCSLFLVSMCILFI